MITFVGSNPSVKNPDPKIPFVGTRSGKVLRTWLDQVTDRDPSSFRFINLSDEVTEGNRPLKMSEVDSANLQAKLEGSIRIVALGKTAAKVLHKLGYSFLELPHPSPRNRVLNDPKNVSNTVESLRSYLKPGLRLKPKNWYGFDHSVVVKRFEGDLSFVCELPMTFKTVDGEVYLPAALYRAANPNRDKGHKEYMALFRNGSGYLVTGREAPELEKDRYVHGLHCQVCDDAIFSMTRHDFNHCSCGAVFVDGGREYNRFGFTSDKPHRSVIIDLISRTVYGPDELRYKELALILGKDGNEA